MNRESTLQAAFRRLLSKLDDIGPASDTPEDLEAFGQVKDYLLDELEAVEVRL